MAKEWKNWGKKSGGGGGSAFYFVGFLGALVYFWQQAPTFMDGVIGLIKAIFWPAFMVYELFKYLNV
jgi:hypothetical protein